ncbi:MAG: tRNA lysidine(34) synthetase TilS [Cyanothece sp. SIO1E1]|nr:tRNA lysidine(34) synthetase TilS [Cyanothece sp. SIO1E1]
MPWSPLHAQIHRTLRQRSLLPQKQRLLVAVSGGQDSLCLSQLLLDLQAKWKWSLAIAHCDHRWRTDSEANAEYVAHLAHTWQLPYHQRSARVQLSSEAAARAWRYQMLTELALAHGYAYVVTGHTASDRAETLLYNLLRGSGTDGLQALTWQRPLGTDTLNLKLVRPLLGLTRSETGQFCQARGLNVWPDATNDHLKYARNRIRQELLPYLQEHFNPQVELGLAQTAEIMQAEVEYLNSLAHDLYQRALGRADDCNQSRQNQRLPIRLNRQILRQAPVAIQRRAIRCMLQDVLPHPPNFDQIEKLTALIKAPNRSRTDPLPGGAIAEVEGDWIWVKCNNHHN